MIMSFSLPIAMHTASSERNQQIYTQKIFLSSRSLSLSLSLSLGGVCFLFFIYRPIISLPFAISHRRKQITEKMKGGREGKEEEEEEEERNRETTSLPTYITSLFSLSLYTRTYKNLILCSLLLSLSLLLAHSVNITHRR